MPKVWSFEKLREVGVFFYFDILCLKIHENGFGCGEAGKSHVFKSLKVEPMLDEGVAYRQPIDWFGTVKK